MNAAQKERRLAYELAFTSEHGRAALRDLVRSYVVRRSYVMGDPYATAFNEGQRDVVRHILAMLGKDEAIVIEGAVLHD